MPAHVHFKDTKSQETNLKKNPISENLKSQGLLSNWFMGFDHYWLFGACRDIMQKFYL